MQKEKASDFLSSRRFHLDFRPVNFACGTLWKLDDKDHIVRKCRLESCRKATPLRWQGKRRELEVRGSFAPL
jgi:hypothetical protein